MGTRSHIGFKFKSGAIISSYCSGDSFPSKNGPILLNHFTNPQKALQLAMLGNFDYLKPEIKPARNRAHNEKKHQEGVILAWHRDCGMDLEVFGAPNETVWKDEFKQSMMNYVYLYDEANEKWLVGKPSFRGYALHDLQKVVDGKVKSIKPDGED